MASFGQRLRRLRRDRGLTQRDLAERLGVDRRTIQRYELGQIFPVPEILAALVLALGLRFEQLFTLAPPMPREPICRRAIAETDGAAEAKS
jgi:transcriptional regulator with XRE-family HTH domain